MPRRIKCGLKIKKQNGRWKPFLRRLFIEMERQATRDIAVKASPALFEIDGGAIGRRGE